MGKYEGQAAGYSSNAEAVKVKLENVKQKYSALLDGFGVSKVNGVLNYSVNQGDYLTDNVVETIDSVISEIDGLIGEIDGRISDINAKATTIDQEEEEAARLAAEKNNDGDNSSESGEGVVA